jgi:DNA-binding beta-propeller fold protein YncE
MFGSPGGGPGMFDKAKGIAFDSFGNVYVSDSQLGLVQIFNSKHQVLMAFGGKLEKPGYMLVPTGLAISSKNTIFVADYAGKCVSQYQLIDTSAEDSFKAIPGAEPSSQGKSAAGADAPPSGGAPAGK